MFPRFINLAERLAACWGVTLNDKLRLAERERAALDGIGMIGEFDTKSLDRVVENPSSGLPLAVLDVDRFQILKHRRDGFCKATKGLERLWEAILHARHARISLITCPCTSVS